MNEKANQDDSTSGRRRPRGRAAVAIGAVVLALSTTLAACGPTSGGSSSKSRTSHGKGKGTAKTKSPRHGRGGSDGSRPSSRGTLEAGVVKGRVTDEAGRPLRGAKVVVQSQVYDDTDLVLVTDGQGSYRAEMPKASGTFAATATITRTRQGTSYTFDLAPDTADPFTRQHGAVRDFTWRTSGRQGSGERWYGGSVTYNVRLGDAPADKRLSPENVHLTLTPVGPLIDGSTGGTIARREPRFTGQGWAVVDVPVGRYRITAEYAAPGGKPRPLLVRSTGTEAFSDEVTADFKQDKDNRQTLSVETRP
ncbi:hypothetical protein GCM10023080_065250 [Streptomyces pseudoechinosporeus]